MTPGTVHGHTARRRHHLCDEIIQIVGSSRALQDLALGLRLSDKIPRPRREKPGRDDRRRIIGPQHITGDLVSQELVIRLVGIDRANHPIAVTPRMVSPLVSLEPMRVGVMSHVEPVPRPTLSIMRRFEQPIDESFIRPRIAIPFKRRDLVRRRRQAMQIKRQPPNQRPPVGLGRGRESIGRGRERIATLTPLAPALRRERTGVSGSSIFRLPYLHHLRRDKPINLIPRPRTRLAFHSHINRRHHRSLHRPDRPPVASRHRPLAQVQRLRPLGSRRDPLAQHRDFARGQRRPFSGHRRLDATDQPHDLALPRLPRHDDHATVPPLNEAALGRERQPSLRLLPRVTSHTPRLQNRCDILRKVDRQGSVL